MLAPRDYLGVGQVTALIKGTLEADEILSRLWVRGEISNLREAGSGHLYFSLKDEEAVLRCVMFRNSRSRLSFAPENGMEVFVQGRIGVFEAQGAYQLYGNAMLALGQGDQYRAFEALRDRLGEEGLFDRKRPLPARPRRIGVVTSGTGAVLQDILRVAGSRNPFVQVVMAPSSVQGEAAAREVCEGIRRLDASGRVDVIVVARGGGSLEDLQAFNTEEVARGIFASSTPVVSAIGHETDFTIADFVSDVRAPTPSAAAALVVPDLRGALEAVRGRLRQQGDRLAGEVDRAGATLEKLARREVLARPCTGLDRRLEILDLLEDRSRRAYQRDILAHQERLAGLLGRIRGLDPLATLARGYVVARRQGRPVPACRGLAPGDRLELRFRDGVAVSRVLEVHPDEEKTDV